MAGFQMVLVMAPGGSMMIGPCPECPSGLLLAGQAVPKELINQKFVEEHTRSGFCVWKRVSDTTNKADNSPSSAHGREIPGANPIPFLAGAKIDTSDQGIATVEMDRDGQIVKKTRPDSPANLDPVIPLTQKDMEPLVTNQKQGEEAPNPVNAGPTGISPGLWDFNPLVLQSRTLENLNLLAGQKDPNVKVFESIEEALTFMTKDFKPTLAQ